MRSVLCLDCVPGGREDYVEEAGAEWFILAVLMTCM
jgi:hypothetical protein